jgi:hypothetical protein
MAEIPIRTVAMNGVNLDLANANANAAVGDTAQCGSNLSLMVVNGSGSDLDVTIVVPGNNSYGVANPDKLITIPTGQTWAIPLLEVYRDPADNLAHITWESTTSVDRIVLRR